MKRTFTCTARDDDGDLVAWDNEGQAWLYDKVYVEDKTAYDGPTILNGEDMNPSMRHKMITQRRTNEGLYQIKLYQ